jgi:hypothetical protein
MVTKVRGSVLEQVSVTDFGAVLDGVTNDLDAFKALSAYADASSIGVAAVLPNDAIMAIDASADGDQVNWSNKLTIYSHKDSEQALPIILINHANTYFFTEDATIAEARLSNFGIDGVEIKGYNTLTTNRWDDDTTGGERNVLQLWLIHDAQPKITGHLRNAADLLTTVSTRAGNFPEQVKLHGRVTDYTTAWRLSESGSGTGSHEHADVDLIITQGKKAAVSDALVRVTNGASLYRMSRFVIRGRADNNGLVGSIVEVDGAGSTFTNNPSITWVLDRCETNNWFNVINGGAVTRNAGVINAPDGVVNVDGSSSLGQNEILMQGVGGIEINGTAAPSIMQNNPNFLISSFAARLPVEQMLVHINASGAVAAGDNVGILPGRGWGNSTDFNTFRVVAIHYFCGTAPSGNTAGEWVFWVENNPATNNRLGAGIPDGSTFGILYNEDAAGGLLANVELPDAWYEEPFRVVSGTTSAGVRNDGTGPSDVFLIYQLATER